MEFRTGQFRLPTPILVVGLGVSGRSILRLLKILGANQQDVFSYDDKDPSAQIRSSQEALRLAPKTLIVSPGVPLETTWIKLLRNSGCLVSSELELAWHYLKSEKVIGVTGSVGKSTVVAILGQGLANDGFVGGNYGKPLADYVSDILEEKRTRVPWIILELSSYQLENFPSLQCHGSIITSLTPNHLERYETLQDYYKIKLTLIEKTKGPVVLNHSGFDLIPTIRKESLDPKQRAQIFSTDRKDPLVKTILQQSSLLLGRHNLDNLAVCVRLAQLLDWPKEYTQGFFEFPGLSHRLENLGLKNGVLFVNDSKATTIASVLQAVSSMKEKIRKARAFHLLLGGRDKNLPWHDLEIFQKLPHTHFYFFGESATKAQALSGLKGATFPGMGKALSSVFKNLRPGDLVLLSPGGTSLDEFKSFEHRGDFFKEEIERWSHDQHPPE